MPTIQVYLPGDMAAWLQGKEKGERSKLVQEAIKAKYGKELEGMTT
ncbi:hypothetical protein J4419_05020 [Candidatus Woesearchaeota archaeon]|nr:hypothetical protein [Candidatus Woesearchaeota archaeon]